eukprot:15196368-Alexandrium_andersonii.AAC.1
MPHVPAAAAGAAIHLAVCSSQRSPLAAPCCTWARTAPNRSAAWLPRRRAVSSAQACWGGRKTALRPIVVAL